MVTRPCQRPSLPRYFDDVVSAAASGRLPAIATSSQRGQVAVQLDPLDTDGPPDLDHPQVPSGNLTLDRSAGAPQMAGDLAEGQQQGRLLGGKSRGLHARHRPTAAVWVVTQGQPKEAADD